MTSLQDEDSSGHATHVLVDSLTRPPSRWRLRTSGQFPRAQSPPAIASAANAAAAKPNMFEIYAFGSRLTTAITRSRQSGECDAVIDFHLVTRDPAQPTRFLPLYDSGDHLHPGDQGYEAMANAIDLRLFRTRGD
jgi:hypothetical protein